MGITLCFGLAIFAISTSKISFPHIVQQAIAQDPKQESIAQNTPTCFPDAIWLMSKSQVKSLFPDAIELVQDDLKLDSIAFTRPAFIDFVFHDNLLVMIIITFKGEKTERLFRLTHLLVINEYGEFPEPSRTNGFILISKKSIGKISIEHNLYEISGTPIEQVMLYKTKTESFVSSQNNSSNNNNTPLRSQDSIEAQKPTGNIDVVKRSLQEGELHTQEPATNGIIGMSKSKVLNLLGDPDSISEWTVSGSRYELLLYWGGHGEVYLKNGYVEGCSRR